MQVFTPGLPNGQGFDGNFRQPWEGANPDLNQARALPDPRGGATSPGNPGPMHITAAHWYAQTISLSFAITTTSQRLLDQPISVRNFLAIRNSSASANVYVGFGTDANPASSWLKLAAGTIILFDTVVPQDDLYFVGDAAGSIAIGYSTTTR